MEDIHHSGTVSMPRVTIDLREFSLAMAPEAEKLCVLLAALGMRLDPPQLLERVREWPALVEGLTS
jgi:hypothetical protein